MPTLVIVMIMCAGAFALWSAGRAAAERAETLGRDACRASGVQWLDQSVHLQGVRLRRLSSGWMGFERTFRFDYSHDGQDRHIGRLVLHGGRLVAFTGPQAGGMAAIDR